MSNHDLFGDVQQSIVVLPESLSQPLTPAQRKFNAALEKIERQKIALAEWQQAHDLCQQEVAYKFDPLKQQLTDEQIQLALFLDDVLTCHKLSKSQQQKLTHLIGELCERLVDHTDHPQLISLYQRYFPETEDTQSAEEKAEMEAAMRAAFKDAFGFSLDESIDLDDPDAITQQVFEQQQAQHSAHTQRPHKKTAKQLEKEAKEQAEAKQAQQSIQSIYRQLVKTLHPDREADADERERKTAIMQQVTVAYEEKNLIKLLELQLQETQISQQLHQLTEDKIKPFIHLLEQQWQQLKADTTMIEQQYKIMLGMSAYDKLTPKKLHAYLREDMRRIEAHLKQIRSDKRMFEQDINALKVWLKYYDIPADDDWY